MAAVGERRAAAEPAGSESFREWGRLMARAQAGDDHAYTTLLRALALFLRGLAARHLGAGGADVEDVVQEILLSVHAIRHTYDPARPFGPWLVTIARRRLVDALRRRSRRLLREVELEDGAAGGPDLDDADPSILAGRVVDITEVRRAVGALPPRQREAIRLLRLQEMSLREAAAASGQSEGALKVASHRALKLLRKLMSRSQGDEHAHD